MDDLSEVIGGLNGGTTSVVARHSHGHGHGHVVAESDEEFVGECRDEIASEYDNEIDSEYSDEIVSEYSADSSSWRSSAASRLRQTHRQHRNRGSRQLPTQSPDNSRRHTRSSRFEDRPATEEPSISRLYELPTELIERVAGFLDGSGICALRWTCRRLYQATYTHFRNTYIATVQTDFSQRSLKSLQELSEDQELAPRVKTLVVQMRNWKAYLGGGFKLTRGNPGGFVLPQTGVRDSCTYSPYHAFITADALALLLSLIMEAGIQVESFCVDFKNRHSSNFLRDRINIRQPYDSPPFFHGWTDENPRRPKDTKFDKMWSDVQSLTFRNAIISLHDHTYFTEAILASTKLQRLEILFGGHCDPPHVMKSLAHRPSTFRLQELRISNAAFGTPAVTEAFNTFLFKHQCSIRKLHLDHLVLLGSWVTLLERVRSNFTSLEDITLSGLWEDSDAGRSGVYFYKILEDPVVDRSRGLRFSFPPCLMIGGHVFNYCGPSMDLAIQRLVDCAEVTPL
ncbi:hypothetical protein BJX61DRAFT_539509 [Aspergillus egyptiacus]|nr:hypothetical protein BJX61DRAFT_539509 [Aspergillus egyptiacus]